MPVNSTTAKLTKLFDVSCDVAAGSGCLCLCFSFSELQSVKKAVKLLNNMLMPNVEGFLW